MPSSYFTGHLYGHPSSRLDLYTGDNLAYIYPDFKTVLRGRFKKGVMLEVKATKILGYR